MGGFKAKPDEILLAGYLPDFTQRLISEPIVQGGGIYGQQGWKKCSLKVVKSQNHGSEESRSLILRISDNNLTKKGERRTEVEKLTPQLLIMTMRIGLS